MTTTTLDRPAPPVAATRASVDHAAVLAALTRLARLINPDEHASLLYDVLAALQDGGMNVLEMWDCVAEEVSLNDVPARVGTAGGVRCRVTH